MSTHSAILGGSNAARLFACPASYAEQLKNPVGDVESVYAAEGTALHQAIAFCMENGCSPEAIIDQNLSNHTLTPELIEVLSKARAMLKRLQLQFGVGWRVVTVENILEFPGITGAFGGVDLVLSNGQFVIVVDWKFGQGIPVYALTHGDGYDEVNAQLMFYGIAARAAYKNRFKNKRVILAIIQPRVRDDADWVEVDHDEMDGFQAAFEAAYLEALGKNPHRERGDHCRFATCKTTCPLWTAPVFDLAVIDPHAAALKASADGNVSDYGNFLSRSLQLSEFVETWITEIRRQAHLHLEDGGQVPGYKLVPKRGTRQWIDPETVPAELYNLGLDDEDMFTEPQLKSPAQMEKAAKQHGVEVPDELFHKVSSGTTIAPLDDKRPAADRGRVIEDLRIALKAL